MCIRDRRWTVRPGFESPGPTNIYLSRDASLCVVLVLGEDAQPVVHTQRAKGANEYVGPTTVHPCPDDAVQRHVAIVNLDRDDSATLAAAGPECRVLFQPIRNELLEVIVFE